MELYRHCRQHENHYGMQLQCTIIFLCVAMNSSTLLCAHFVVHTARSKYITGTIYLDLSRAIETAEMWPRVEIWNINNVTTTIQTMLMLTGVQLGSCAMYRRAHTERVPSIYYILYMHSTHFLLQHAVSTFTPLRQFEYRKYSNNSNN